MRISSSLVFMLFSACYLGCSTAFMTAPAQHTTRPRSSPFVVGLPQKLGISSRSSDLLQLSVQNEIVYLKGTLVSRSIKLKKRLGRLIALCGNVASWRRRCWVLRRKAVVFVLSLCLVLGYTFNPAMAVTGGRAGGTFKSSHRPSVSRNFSTGPRHTMMPRRVQPLPRMIYASPPMGHSYAHSQGVMMSRSKSAMSKTDVLVLGSVAGLATYGIINGRRQDRDTTQGATATAIMLAVNVPDRYSPDSIVQRINEIAKRTDTSSQRGVQTLISEGTQDRIHKRDFIRRRPRPPSLFLLHEFIRDFYSLPRTSSSASFTTGCVV